MPRMSPFPFLSGDLNQTKTEFLYWIRTRAYYIMLIFVVLALFFTNYIPGTVVSTDKTVFAFIQNAGFVPFPVFTYLFPLLCLFAGALGMLVLLEHIRLHEKKRLMGFVGACAYILNPFTLTVVHDPYAPALWFIAVLPWLLWTFLVVLCDKTVPAGKKLFLFSLAHIVATQAFVDFSFFLAYLVILLVVCTGLIFSIYFFQAVWRSPWLVILAVILQIPWLGPLLFQINQPALGTTFEPAQMIPLPSSIDPWLVPLLVLAAFGFFLLQRYYIVFLLLLGIVIAEWIPFPDYVLQVIKPYSYYFFIPLGFVLAYFVAAGTSSISLIAHFFATIFRNNKTKNRAVWKELKGKSPYDIYQEIALETKYRHNTSSFTPIPFTEHFLEHILKHPHHPVHERKRQKNMLPRIIAYLAFIVIVICNVGVFTGQLFSNEYQVSLSSSMNEVMRQLRPLNTAHVAYIPDDTPASIELKTAIERENERILQAVIEKYLLSHIVVDATHLLPSHMQFMGKQQYLTLEKNADGIYLFSLKTQPDTSRRFYLARNMPNIGPAAAKLNDDIAYRNHGLYMTSEETPYSAYYPFLALAQSSFMITEKTTRLETVLGNELMSALDDYELESGTESATITLTGDAGQILSIPATMYPELIANRMVLTMNNQRIRYFNPKQEKDDAVYLETQALEHKYGYLVNVLNTKEPNRIYQIDVTDASRQYELLDTTVTSNTPFVLAPTNENGSGYIFGITPERFENITVYYLPYQEILSTRFVKTDDLTKRARLVDPPAVNQIAPGIYEVTVEPIPGDPETLIFLDKFSSGWKMYEKDPAKVHNALETLIARWLPFFYGKEYGRQVSVNNWANGWVVDKAVLDNTVIVVDIPRYIGYSCWFIAGLFILIFGFMWFTNWYKNLE